MLGFNTLMANNGGVYDDLVRRFSVVVHEQHVCERKKLISFTASGSHFLVFVIGYIALLMDHSYTMHFTDNICQSQYKL